jgi:hypothetical protein
MMPHLAQPAARPSCRSMRMGWLYSAKRSERPRRCRAAVEPARHLPMVAMADGNDPLAAKRRFPASQQLIEGP